jgi:tRNA 2-selenouridine synthase
MNIVSFTPDLPDTHFLVDVRTPLEFEDDHLPGAANFPLLTNEERVEIGTLYKHAGPHAARIRGLELTAHRFPGMVRDIGSASEGRPIAVYCWRGGLRSKTVVSILDLTGHRVAQLEGGYRSFRNHVASFFDPFVPPGPLVVIHGLTGTGKTELINGMTGKNYLTIDLEGLACHRGSSFGELGLSQTLTQKRFETLLWNALRKAEPGKPVILEGESRRIGRMTLPGDLYEKMQQGVKVWCEASLDTRVARLIEEYGREEYREEMSAALARIAKRLGGKKYAEISEYLENWDMPSFMRELLVGYYDRLYYKFREWEEDFVLPVDDLEQARLTLERFLSSRFEY